MEEILITVLKFSYGIGGVVGLVAYLPTIKDLHIHKKQSANTSSYLIWLVTAVVSFLYSVFILNDLLVRVLSGVNVVAVSLVFFLILNLRNKAELS